MKIEIAIKEAADQVMIQILKTRATESPLSDVAEILPMNVKLMTVNLKVVLPNFEQFERFLHEVENLERITRVETLSFRQPGKGELLNMDMKITRLQRPFIIMMKMEPVPKNRKGNDLWM
jgi:hypothetical protein